MKFVALGGEPATGKTTLTRRLFRDIDDLAPIKYGLLRMQVSNAKKLYILGIYNFKLAMPFEGTDKLAMSVVVDARKFLKWANLHRNNYTVFFEGDRLFTQDFIDTCKQKGETKVYVLKCDPDVLEKRHAERNDEQDSSWLKGRATKLNNIIEEESNRVTVLRNQDKADMLRNIELLRTELGV